MEVDTAGVGLPVAPIKSTAHASNAGDRSKEYSLVIRKLREDMVKRSIQRQDGWFAELRAHPDHYPALIEGKYLDVERRTLQILATFLLDPKTQLPVEVDSMHRRVR